MPTGAMKLFMILIAACVISNVVMAQDSSFVWTENSTIQWDDFMGQAKDSSLYDAEVFAEIRYKYEFYKRGNPKFEVFAIFNRNTSWSKPTKQSMSLLKHEQLHFDIAELYALKLKETLEASTYTTNFTQEILEKFNVVKAAYHTMQIRCDEETNHSLNKEKQAEWEAYVKIELSKAGSYATVNQPSSEKVVSAR